MSGGKTINRTVCALLLFGGALVATSATIFLVPASLGDLGVIGVMAFWWGVAGYWARRFSCSVGATVGVAATLASLVILWVVDGSYTVCFTSLDWSDRYTMALLVLTLNWWPWVGLGLLATSALIGWFRSKPVFLANAPRATSRWVAEPPGMS